MYGYVSINARTLDKEDYARFRAVYCGLCHALAVRYGQASRLTLSYDMTVLQLLLSSLYDEEETQGRERCAERPVIAHHYACGSCADYAADMSILLAYYKALDDQADEGRAPQGVKGRAVRQAFETVRAKYPDKYARIDAAFRENSRLEREDGGNIDAAANCTGAIIAEIYAWREDFFAPMLREMGRALGRFIYLMDAYEDLPADVKKNRSNPLRALSQHGDYDREMRQILMLEMNACTAAFERLPLVRDMTLMRNIFYSGVWGRYAWLCKKRGVPLDDAPGKDSPDGDA